jgi:type II restriction enzyme
VKNADLIYVKYITANDTGTTGSHQSGIHISKNAWPLLFESPGEKGFNKDQFRSITWNEDIKTESRFVYYGSKTRNEYRITRFQRNFPYLKEEFEGSLLILTKTDDEFKAFVLGKDEEIDSFFASTGFSHLDLNRLIGPSHQEKDLILECIDDFVESITSFPSSNEVSRTVQDCFKNSNTYEKLDIDNDELLLQWLALEYKTFKKIEDKVYSARIRRLFTSVEELVIFANTVLNRRKSRAGKSLEHHLSEIFRREHLKFDAHAKTEENHIPDFLFPGVTNYKDPTFDRRFLTMLAAKTTCKDRWRQILSEADRIKTKHLFTLQQGISANQLSEMVAKGVILVVPSSHIESFPRNFRSTIVTLKSFLNQVKENQRRVYGRI